MRAALVSVVLVWGALARAEAVDDQIARAHFATGLSYYDSERYAPAVKEFLEAYRLSTRPALLYNIARSYEHLEDAGHATTFYRRYLAALPGAPERVEVEAAIARLRGRVATLTLNAGAGGDVLVDGEPAGTAPIEPLELTEGKHRFEVRRGGAAPVMLELTLRGGEAREVTAEPLAAPAPGETQRRRWLGIGLGIGAAVLAAAAVAIALALSLHGTDYSTAGLAGCQPPGCLFVPGS